MWPFSIFGKKKALEIETALTETCPPTVLMLNKTNETNYEHPSVKNMQSANDKLCHAYCYRLRRDALFIAAQRPRGQADNLYLHWVQRKLLDGMNYDPNIPDYVKDFLADFHARTTRVVNEDRRGQRMRGQNLETIEK